MATLIDTNILLRSVQPTHAMHASAVRALARLMEQGEPLVISIQNVAEFWNVATRPASSNGLGFLLRKPATRSLSWKAFLTSFMKMRPPMTYGRRWLSTTASVAFRCTTLDLSP